MPSHSVTRPLQTFYEKLGPPGSDVNGQLSQYLAALQKIIAQLESVYEMGNYAKGM